MPDFEDMTEAAALDHLERLTGQRPAASTRRMLALEWKCSTCSCVTRFDSPSPSPAPCTQCDGIFFECSSTAVN